MWTYLGSKKNIHTVCTRQKKTNPIPNSHTHIRSRWTVWTHNLSDCYILIYISVHTRTKRSKERIKDSSPTLNHFKARGKQWSFGKSSTEFKENSKIPSDKWIISLQTHNSLLLNTTEEHEFCKQLLLRNLHVCMSVYTTLCAWEGWRCVRLIMLPTHSRLYSEGAESPTKSIILEPR